MTGPKYINPLKSWGHVARRLGVWLLVAAMVVLYCFTISKAEAQQCSATLNWQAPTENTDGSPLTDLAGFLAYWGTAPENLTNSIDLPDPDLRSYIVEGLPNETRVWFAMTARNDGDLESAFSNLTSKVCPAGAPDPAAPGVTVNPSVVYDYVPQENGAIVLAVGTVPPDTVCDVETAIMVSGVFYYRVPREAVDWFGDVEPPVVFSQCE